jgi:membrane protease YdiL (CAAX protease family)
VFGMMSELVRPTEPSDHGLSAPTGEASRGPKRSVFREFPWRWTDVIVGFAPDITMSVAGALINPAWLWVGPRWLWLPFAVTQMAWMLLYPLWIVRRRARLPRLPRPRTVFVEALFALLGLAVAMVVLSAVFSALFLLFGDRATATMPWKPIAASPNWYDSLGLLVVLGLMAPVAEEVFYRGMLYNALRRRLHVVVAAPVQAIIFGLSHHYGAADTTVVVLLGLALALLYEWRKTLLAPVLMHALVNALTIAIMAQSVAADAAAPRLGVYGETHERGVRLTIVEPDTAAASAGLQVGDVIVSLDGERVADFPGLTQAVRTRQVGQTVVVEFIRGAVTHRVDAVLKKLRE